MPAREIKTTLAVDGEQAYKRALNDAKTSIRNLGTQLTLAQAEFKKSGDAQKLMETRAKTLKAEIDQQNEIVRSLDQALADAKKQYGEGSQEAEKWEAELNRAKATMASLESELNNNEKGLDRSGKAFEDAGEKAGEFSDAVNNVSRGISFEMITSGIGKITSGFENAIKKATELAGQMWNMMRDAASWADDEITLAKIYGVDVEELQQMQHAAKMVDTDIDTIVKARQKLAKAMGSELKSDEIQKAFQTLRTPVYDDNGKMRDMENVFWEAGDALMNLDDEVAQNNVAMQLFGKSWMELKPLFDAGRKAYSEAMAEATVVPKENIEKLGALQDQLDRLDTEFQTLKMNVLSELAPAFEVLAKSLTDLMAEFNEYLQTDEGKAMMDSLSEAITAFFTELTNIDLASAVGTVSDGLNLVKEGLLWIKDNKETVVDALKGIGIAFGALKVVEIAANIGKVVWGFKQLMPGGGSSGVNTQSAANAAGQAAGAAPAASAAPAAAATGTGFWARAWTAAKTGAGSMAQTGLFALPALMGIDGIIQDMKLLEQMRQKGVQATQRTEAISGAFRGSDAYDEWDALNAYLNMPDTTAGKGKMDSFAEDYFKWFNDDLQNAVFDKLTEGMSDEEFEAFHEAMLGLRNGDATYSEADIEARFGPLRRALEIVEEILSESGPLDAGIDTGLYAPAGGGTAAGNRGLTGQDLADFQKVPGQMAAEVGKAVGGIKVQMDGTTVGRLVAPTVSNYIANQIQ